MDRRNFTWFFMDEETRQKKQFLHHSLSKQWKVQKSTKITNEILEFNKNFCKTYNGYVTLRKSILEKWGKNEELDAFKNTLNDSLIHSESLILKEMENSLIQEKLNETEFFPEESLNQDFLINSWVFQETVPKSRKPISKKPVKWMLSKPTRKNNSSIDLGKSVGEKSWIESRKQFERENFVTERKNRKRAPSSENELEKTLETSGRKVPMIVANETFAKRYKVVGETSRKTKSQSHGKKNSSFLREFVNFVNTDDKEQISDSKELNSDVSMLQENTSIEDLDGREREDDVSKLKVYKDSTESENEVPKKAILSDSESNIAEKPAKKRFTDFEKKRINKSEMNQDIESHFFELDQEEKQQNLDSTQNLDVFKFVESSPLLKTKEKAVSEERTILKLVQEDEKKTQVSKPEKTQKKSGARTKKMKNDSIISTKEEKQEPSNKKSLKKEKSKEIILEEENFTQNFPEVRKTYGKQRKLDFGLSKIPKLLRPNIFEKNKQKTGGSVNGDDRTLLEEKQVSKFEQKKTNLTCKNGSSDTENEKLRKIDVCGEEQLNLKSVKETELVDIEFSEPELENEKNIRKGKSSKSPESTKSKNVKKKLWDVFSSSPQTNKKRKKGDENEENLSEGETRDSKKSKSKVPKSKKKVFEKLQVEKKPTRFSKKSSENRNIEGNLLKIQSDNSKSDSISINELENENVEKIFEHDKEVKKDLLIAKIFGNNNHKVDNLMKKMSNGLEKPRVVSDSEEVKENEMTNVEIPTCNITVENKLENEESREHLKEQSGDPGIMENDAEFRSPEKDVEMPAEIKKKKKNIISAFIQDAEDDEICMLNIPEKFLKSELTAEKEISITSNYRVVEIDKTFFRTVENLEETFLCIRKFDEKSEKYKANIVPVKAFTLQEKLGSFSAKKKNRRNVAYMFKNPGLQKEH